MYYNKFIKFSIISIILLMLMSTYFNNFILMWMILEIMTLIFITMINISQFKKSSLLYFVISAISSMMMMYAYLFMFNYNFNEYLNIYWYMFIYSIWLKLGLFPLHLWTNIFTKSLDYMLMYLFFTLMKFIPMMMIYYFIDFNMQILFFSLITLIITPFLMINKSSFKLMFTYSSMFQTTIMILFLYTNSEIWMNYFSMYLIITFMFFSILKKLNIDNKNDLKNIWYKNDKNLITMLLIMYSQFPPFSSFLMKSTMTENFLMFSESFWNITLIIIFTSMFMTFNYLMYFNLNFIENSYSRTFNLKFKFNYSNIFIFLMMFMFFMIFMMPMIY